MLVEGLTASQLLTLIRVACQPCGGAQRIHELWLSAAYVAWRRELTVILALARGEWPPVDLAVTGLVFGSMTDLDGNSTDRDMALVMADGCRYKVTLPVGGLIHYWGLRQWAVRDRAGLLLPICCHARHYRPAWNYWAYRCETCNQIVHRVPNFEGMTEADILARIDDGEADRYESPSWFDGMARAGREAGRAIEALGQALGQMSDTIMVSGAVRTAWSAEPELPPLFEVKPKPLSFDRPKRALTLDDDLVLKED